jgi:hypothetical protein
LNQMAYRLVRESTEGKLSVTQAQIDGRRDGAKGGIARAAKLSPEQRSEIARKAAQARWASKAAS